MDARIKKTKDKLHKALLELLESKALPDISVSELCKAADVNRTTFYVHYGNVTECFREISDRILSDMRDQLHRKGGYSTADFLRIYFKTARKNQTVFRAIHSTNIYDPMIRSMVEMNNELIHASMFVPKGNENLSLTYIFSGFYGMVSAWLQAGCQESDEELLEIMRQMFPGQL